MTGSKTDIPRVTLDPQSENACQHVLRAREAHQTWSSLSINERKYYLLNWRRELVRRIEDFVRLIGEENGKNRWDSVIEVFAAVYHATYALKRAVSFLKPKKLSTGLLINYGAMLHYEPLGVIAIISPWNMPLSIPFIQIVSALISGNSVILKPSEVTPEVGKLIAETSAVIPIKDLVQVICGDGSVGSELIRSGVDKVAVTGSFETGKAIMKVAAENVTPLLLELGGQDALIVAEDADLVKTARRTVWGSFVMAGQACISVERCFVVRSVYDVFLDEVLTEVKRLSVGVNEDIPPMANSRQVEVVRQHVQDALDKGAQLLHGSLAGICGKKVPPMILVNVDESMVIAREETFGPVLVIYCVDDLEMAIQATNNSAYALGASIFGYRDIMDAAGRLKAGMVSVNSVWAYTLIAGLPFGGHGKSGFGRMHGEAGVLEFVNVKAIAVERACFLVDLMSFGAAKIIGVARFIAVVKFFFGRGGKLAVNRRSIKGSNLT